MTTPVRLDNANSTSNTSNQSQPASQNQQPQPSNTYDPTRSTMTSLSENENSDFDASEFAAAYHRLSIEEPKYYRSTKMFFVPSKIDNIKKKAMD